MKAATKFKNLLHRNASGIIEGMFNGAPIVAPPSSIQYRTAARAHSDLANDRDILEGTLAAEGVHRDIIVKDDFIKTDKRTEGVNQIAQKCQSPTSQGSPERPGPIPTSPDTHPVVETASTGTSDQSLARISSVASPGSGKGQAHDPLEDTLFLQIGAGSDDPLPDDDIPIVSESPGAVDFTVYERAYEEELQKIIAARAAEPNPRRPTIYLTKRVEGNKYIREHQAITDWSRSATAAASATAYTAAEGAAWGINKLTEVAKSGYEAGLGLHQDMTKQLKSIVAGQLTKTGAAEQDSFQKAQELVEEIEAVKAAKKEAAAKSGAR
jgi:[calcium/calmodulin-dependent protein kinase] kinase